MRTSDLDPLLEQLSFKIPLQVDLTSITGWLDALDPELACQSCGKILRLLKSLHSEKLAPDVEFKILGKLRAVLDPVALKLEKPFMDAGNPFAETEQINAELIIFSYAELAQRFWHVADNSGALQKPELNSQMIAAALFQGMEALRRALFYISLLYDEPYESFWRLCYSIYRRGESLNILETGVAGSAAGNDCINNSFKNLMVFYLSDSRLLTQKEMKALYNLFNHRQVLAKIYTGIPEDKANLLFGFDLDSDLPPMRVRHMGTRQGELRYVSTLKIARAVCRYLKGKEHKQDSLETGNYALFLKIAKVLGMQASRAYTRVAEKRNCPGLVGFNNVFKYLARKNPVIAGAGTAQMLNGHLSAFSPEWVIPDFSLVPRGEEDFYRKMGSKNDGKESNAKLSQLFEDRNNRGLTAENEEAARGFQEHRESGPIFEKIEILDSSAKDYGVLLKTPKAAVKVGDLLGLLQAQDDRFEIGLVSRISSSGKQDIKLGVELLSLQAETAIIWQPAKTQSPQVVLFLPRIPVLQQHDTIIYPTHRVSIDDTIVLQMGENKIYCRIRKLLHATSAFSHAELTVVEAKSTQDR